MTAELIQGSPEWHAARLGNVTSSKFGVVMTKGRSGGMSQAAKSYMMQLIGERLTGQPADEIKSKYLEWGHKYEPIARQLYQWEMADDHTLRQVGFIQHPTLEHVGGSPDCLIDDDGVMEIKCPYVVSNHLHTITDEEVTSKDYQWQCQGNMWVTGRKWLDYVSFHPLVPERLQMKIVRVERDDDMIEQLEERIIQFLEQMEIKLAKINH